MSNNSAKYEVLVKQNLRSILDIRALFKRNLPVAVYNTVVNKRDMKTMLFNVIAERSNSIITNKVHACDLASCQLAVY